MAAQRKNSPRLTAADLDVINEALALLEADLEGEEPDVYDEDAEPEHADWERRLADVTAVRVKIFRRQHGHTPR